jgi:hypothetical protein
MPVTDLQVATLRALLVNDFDESRRLMAQISEDELRQGYFPFVQGAFWQAVEHRFRGKKRSDMIEWVAGVRANVDSGNQIDPNVAERLILWVFGKASVDDIDFETDYSHQTMLLGLLVEEQGFDDGELDAFLREARAFTDKMMGRPE